MQTQSEIRQTITTKLAQSLREGRIPWRKPWTGFEGPRTPTNLVSKHRYSGVNILLTLLAEQHHGWPVSYWATFNQFRQLGCHVRKGERATTIVYYQQIKKTEKDKNGDEKERTIPLLKTWSIFNVAQAEGGAVEKFNAKPELKTFEGVDRTEFDAAVVATGARINFGHEQAAYLPLEDRIVMPDEGRFDTFSDFAATLLHEIGHWSEKRLDWTGSYALNELRAEILSSFLMSALGVPHSDDLQNVKAYIQSWIQALENDPRFIFQASTAASKAADYVLSFSRPQSENGADLDATVAVSA